MGLTSLGFDVFLLVDQRVLGRFRAEGQRDEHEYARHDNDGQQYGPPFSRTQNVVQTQYLGNQYGNGDDQLVNGSDLHKPSVQKRCSIAVELSTIIVYK